MPVVVVLIEELPAGLAAGAAGPGPAESLAGGFIGVEVPITGEPCAPGPMLSPR